jgi:hypothetical protein
MSQSKSRIAQRMRAYAAVTLLGTAISVSAQSTAPVVLTFSTVGDSRQDPVSYDQASVGATLTGQDAIWLQNTKAISRIVRTIQSQKSQLLFFNGDMIHGFGWDAFGETSNATQSSITSATSFTTSAQVLGSDLVRAVQEYGFWRGMMGPVFEAGTYVFPVPGNHETQCKACGKVAKVENEQTWSSNMGDLIVDTARFQSMFGAAPANVAFGPAAGASPDGLTTDQSKLGYSFDYQGFHFAVINTDPVGADSTAPTQWLAADLSAAKARGAKKMFVFGHKPAFTYQYASTVTPAGLDVNVSARDAFWSVIEQYRATYFCGHQHTVKASQPKGGAYQVIVGSGGSPFDPKAGTSTINPSTDRDYAWATVRLHADGGVDILVYGFNGDTTAWGPTQLLFNPIYLN